MPSLRMPAAVLAILVACTTIQNRPLLKEVELQGHRGARGLMPENTWPAFRAAIENGMNVLELDTVLTRENDLVVHHDSNTNPANCRNDDGTPISSVAIRSLSVAELKKLDCGSLPNKKFPEQKQAPSTRLLTLDEFFANIRALEKGDAKVRRLTFNIEAKFPDGETSTDAEIELFAKILTGKVQRAKMSSRATLQSFELKILPLLKKYDGDIKTSALFEPSYFEGLRMYIGLGGGVRQAIIDKTLAARADIVSPYKLYANAEFVRDAHAKNLAVIVWTVNEIDEMRALLARGVDGIISDYPDRLATAAKTR